MTNDNRRIHLGGTARRPEDVLSLHRLGLQFAEVPINNPEKFSADVERFRRVQVETGLYYLCHGPREGDPNDLHTLETIYFPKLGEVVSIMPALGMQLLTVHLWMDPRFVKPQTLDYKVDFLRRLIQLGDESGITICLENLSESAEHLARIFSGLPSQKMTLDLGHAELLTEQNSSFGFIERFPERIRHIHVHDNRGGDSYLDDLHLPVGQGTIDFQRIFQSLNAAGYHGTMTLELPPAEIEQCLDDVKMLLLRQIA